MNGDPQQEPAQEQTEQKDAPEKKEEGVKSE
jgi:hypothetical protein